MGKNCGEVSNIVSRSSVQILLRTSVFNSQRSWVVHAARDVPTLSEVTKKLLSKSETDTIWLSKIVKAPIPGRTMFFKISVPVALMRHIWADSKGDHPIISTLCRNFVFHWHLVIFFKGEELEYWYIISIRCMHKQGK